MALRKINLANNEFYHIYNRGVDKRTVFEDKQDFFQFIQMLDYFNQEKSLGGLKEYKYPKNLKHRGSTSVLVEIIAYCLNDNHYHLILKQVVDNGISKLMQKIGTGYTMYFNQKNERTGALFAGRFKSKYIDTDSYLNHVGVYVNLNNRVHNKHRGSTSVSILTHVSSWNEYMNKSKFNLCKKDYLLANFNNIDNFKKYSEDALKEIIKNKEIDFEI